MKVAALPDQFAREVHCILGLPFDTVDLAGVTRRVHDAAREKEKLFLSTPNLNWVVACQSDTKLRDSVIDSDLSIVDGMPLVWVARWLRIPISERVAGSSVFDALRSSRTQRVSVFFFGGPEGIAELACQRLNQNVEGTFCVGYESPGFGSVDDMSSEDMIAGVNSSGADFIVVALGARKGQAWIDRNRARLSAPVISHLGAVVNFIAGTVGRAPRWMQRSGLEWLWRIKEENGLWRRYFSDGLVFLKLLVTCVFPYALLLLAGQPKRQDIQQATAEVREQDGWAVIVLRGAWLGETLGPVRESFRYAARSGLNVRLDMAGVSYVDSAFVGLLLLLSGACRRQSTSLDLGRPTKAVERILRYSGADHLLHQKHGRD